MLPSGADVAFTTYDYVQVTPAGGLIVPAMAATPLQTALENVNYLWKWHRPPLVDVCPTTPGTAGRGTFVHPIIPSADGLRYSFQVRAMPTNNGTATITVDYCTAYSGGGTAWTNLYTVNPAITAATLLTDTRTNYVIPATAVALRFDVQVSAGTVRIDHFLVYPTPDAPTAGIQPSGYIPWDNGLLQSVAGAAVNTEYLNRAKLSVLNLLRDRRQQAVSFLQEETGTPHVVQTKTTWRSFPRVRAYFPFQGPSASLAIRALVDVTAGSTSGLVRVRQVGGTGEPAVFDATGAITSDTLAVDLQGTGLMRHADLEVSLLATAGNTTRLRSISGYWRPTE